MSCANLGGFLGRFADRRMGDAFREAERAIIECASVCSPFNPISDPLICNNWPFKDRRKPPNQDPAPTTRNERRESPQPGQFEILARLFDGKRLALFLTESATSDRSRSQMSVLNCW